MILKLNSVEIDGFLSYDHEVICLDNLGLTRIIGINHYDDKTKSNGSGKSSIPSAILWCMTGKTERGATEVANTLLSRGVAVILELSIDNNLYKIVRSKDHTKYGTGLSIYQNDKDISGNTKTKSDKILKSILDRMDYSMLTSIILLSQGLPNRLSNLSPSSRKSKLEELSNTEAFVSEFKSKLDSTKQMINSELMTYNNTSVKLNSEISSETNHIANYTDKLNQIIAQDDSSISKEEYTKLSNKLNDTRDAALRLQNDIHELELSRTSLINAVNIATSDNTRLINENKEFHTKYEMTKNSKCPTCHQIISGDISKSIINNIKSKIMKNKSLIKDNFTIIEDNPTKIKEFTDRSEELSLKYKEFQTSIAEISHKIKDYVEVSNDAKDLLTKSIEESNAVITKNNEELIDVTKNISKYTDDLEICKWIESQLSRKFRSFLLSGIIDFFNNKSLEYSPYLFEKSVVSLSSNGNNLDIKLNDRDFSNLSSGEARRVDIILQLIERDLARSESNLVSNILVLDEILDGLDSEGIKNVMNLIEYKSPDISTIILISHKNDIEVATDNIITVEKGEDQISRIIKGLEYVNNQE